MGQIKSTNTTWIIFISKSDSCKKKKKSCFYPMRLSRETVKSTFIRNWLCTSSPRLREGFGHWHNPQRHNSQRLGNYSRKFLSFTTCWTPFKHQACQFHRPSIPQIHPIFFSNSILVTSFSFSALARLPTFSFTPLHLLPSLPPEWSFWNTLLLPFLLISHRVVVRGVQTSLSCRTLIRSGQLFGRTHCCIPSYVA